MQQVLSMKMPATTMWPHTAAVRAPVCTAVIIVALAPPVLFKPARRRPNMVGSAGNYMHTATTEIKKYQQKSNRQEYLFRHIKPKIKKIVPKPLLPGKK